MVKGGLDGKCPALIPIAVSLKTNNGQSFENQVDGKRPTWFRANSSNSALDALKAVNEEASRPRAHGSVSSTTLRADE